MIDESVQADLLLRGQIRPTAARRFGLRWLPISVFFLYSALNMLDRQLLAAAAPAIRSEFHLSNSQYGLVVSVFSAVSMLTGPFAGLYIDWVGLTIGATVALVLWSAAGIATGFTHTFRGLVSCRVLLAAGESGGGASPGAVLSQYMDARQLGIGAAWLAGAVSLGAIAAPLVTAALAPRYGWRSVFIVCGVLGFLWVPLWLFTARFAPPRFPARRSAPIPIRRLFGDRRFWGILVLYAMSRQTLWVSWTTLYFVQARGLTFVQANERYSWYPSAFGALGVFLVGALAMRWIRKGWSGSEARSRLCWLFSPLVLATAAVPFIPSATLAALAIGASFLGAASIWTNAHLMPIDLYGVTRSAFAYAVLECGYTALQTVISPVVGALIDAHGFTPVCLLMPLFPLAGLLVFRACFVGDRNQARSVPHVA